MFASITALNLLPLWLNTKKESCLIVDVREDNEYTAMYIPDSLHIPLRLIPDSLDRIPKDQTVYLICQGGMRSAQAASWLAEQAGYTKLVNVEGGMTAWIQAGYPTK